MKERSYQNIISKTSKQIVLFFETNFAYPNITIEGCIEALLSNVLSLSKKGKKAIESTLLYSEVKDYIRDFKDLAKIVPTPSYLLKQLIFRYMLRAEK